MSNYQKEFEYSVRVDKELKYNLEKMGIESDEAMEELIIKLLEQYTEKEKKSKLNDLLFDDKFWDDINKL